LLDRLLQIASDVAREQEVDVAVVLQRDADRSQAQNLRRAAPGTWKQLGQALINKAQLIAERARAGELVPFMGAGVSTSAGLPLRKGLVEQLLAQVTLPAEEHASFRKLHVMDQAHVLRQLFTEEKKNFAEAVATHMSADRYGLAPVLLAALPTTETVTLNYDTLYEQACSDLCREIAILPDEAVRPGERWLLKLHGTITRPDTIVLTREDYLGYGRGREALSALAKALLLTKDSQGN
jgi:hypothetical protein